MCLFSAERDSHRHGVSVEATQASELAVESGVPGQWDRVRELAIRRQSASAAEV